MQKDENGISVLDYVLNKLTELTRYFEGRNPTQSMLIVDSKSIQNADAAKEKGYDGGYTGADFAEKIKAITGADVEIDKRSELYKFTVFPKRWVVERTFGWFDKCRRLWKNCECLIGTILNMVRYAFISILLKRF